jgi:hypothetical protein
MDHNDTVDAILKAIEDGCMTKFKYYHHVVLAKSGCTRIPNILMKIVQHGQLEMLKLFISKKANERVLKKLLDDISVYPSLFLTICVTNSRLVFLKYFVDSGYMQNDSYKHIIEIAAGCGNMEIVKYFCELNSGFVSEISLNNAAACGYLDVVKFLLTYFTDDITSAKESAYIVSVVNKHYHVANYLYSPDCGKYVYRIIELCMENVYDRHQWEYVANIYFNNKINDDYTKQLLLISASCVKSAQFLSELDLCYDRLTGYYKCINANVVTVRVYYFSYLTLRQKLAILGQSYYVKCNMHKYLFNEHNVRPLLLKIKTSKSARKHNLLKSTLKPTGLHIQMTFF